MSARWPFTVHREDRFLKLIAQLCQAEIVEMVKISANIQQLRLKNLPAFLEIFKIVFLLYVTPNDKHIRFQKNKLITKGQFIDLALTTALSAPAQKILDTLITQEDDAIYEAAFNALLAVYIGSQKPLEFIFPNTYIIELGRHTHEFDIFCGLNPSDCLIIETTRGFAKDYDRIEESYTWHFKKAIFRKWMVEKLYQVKCQLWYITLQGQFEEEDASKTLPEELKEEQEVIESSNKLLETILAYERNKIRIIDLGVFHKTVSLEDIESLLNIHLFEKIQSLLL